VAFNYLLLALAAVVGVALVLLFNQHLLHRKSLKIKPPMTAKWLARHPDGQISSIDFYYTNENGKKMWKFSESDIEVSSEFWQDIIVEDGAWMGNGFFVFRKNRSGSVTPWQDPMYHDYFMNATRIRKEVEAAGQENFQKKDLEAMAKQSYKKMLSDGFDEDYAESQYGLERKLLEFWMKRGKKGGGMPPMIPTGGEPVGEAQGD